ncbi:NAD-dependent epimerase/dehydratase family protein [Conexibacter stalactiti]|uniref:NAD-dependent epimerase/dehydratase family protein n=1 Tax=Conexibacter stalactiti TaxID=1940611 RepID=A0ABU4HSU4_9ACTN|nr:NAD-dependent epimerase/dehydratase family protein [Conexibacter stalactiti]MDW5596366.1 NAD-dependent epimerase/dehydratase family protein [Conexibacter stalactiti]MEC5037008.1 NAD-dependent epimerase/dehydratase family protein [Conexibacter stalactiti]
MESWTLPRRVFVTGARGFIGAALAQRYRAAGAEVRGVDHVADRAAGIVAGDIAAPGAWQEHAAGCDLVVHTAAVVSNAQGHDASWRVNVLGTRNVLDAAARGSAERFLHLSSVRAFSDLGFPADVEERHPVRPDGAPYVDTKIASEHVVLQAHAGGELACTIVRPGDVYGPGSRPWIVMPLELIRARRFALPAMGRGRFSPVYVDDLADGIAAAAGAAAASGQVLTLAGGLTVSTREFFAHHHRWAGRRGPLLLPTPVALAGATAVAAVNRLRGVESEVNPVSMRYFARTGGYSIAKARVLLGYEPAVTLEDGMRRTEAWLAESGLI